MEAIDRHQKLITRYTPDVAMTEVTAALKMLDALKIRESKPDPNAPAYDRKALSLKWDRIATLGADVKDFMLARAMNPASLRFDADGFTVKHGQMTDPYTGEYITFEQVRNKQNRVIELDHVVALADAFRSGASRWKSDSRTWLNLYNDPGNLIATDKSANAKKGDQHAGKWLPARHSFRARYVIMQIQIKTRYRLSVATNEADAMRTVLEKCQACDH